MGDAPDDIEQRRLIEQLRASERRFELVSNATNDALWDWDLRSDQLWWSDGFERLFGRAVASLPGGLASWTSFIHPDDQAWVVDSIHEAIAGGAPTWSAEYRFIHRDGRTVWVLDRAQFERNDDGRATRAVGGMTDITAQYEAQEALQARAELLDLTGDAIVVRDPAGLILYWNRGAERLYGWPQAAALGRSERVLLYDDPTGFDVATAELRAEGSWAGVLHQRRRDGRHLVVESRWTRLTNRFGRREATLAVSSDVTERREMELQLLRTQRLESIGTLAGGLAHDLNNLLAPVLMSIELLRSDEVDPEKLAVVDLIAESTGRSADLIRQILSFARGATAEPEPVALATVVDDLHSSVLEALPGHIDVVVDVDPACPAVLGDRTQLMQVLLNLCLNARDAMADQPSGTLTVAVQGEPARGDTADGGAASSVALVVADTGVGIDPEVRERLFDPFFTTKDPGHGTGLGLPSTLAIVRSHGGDIDVESTVGVGSTFKVRFPAAQHPVPVPRSEHTEPDGVAVPLLGGTVLVVDDEASVLRVTQLLLEANGIDVLTALDAAEAQALVEAHGDELAAVLTDATMPGTGGVSLAEWIGGVRPSLPVVLVSGDLHAVRPFPEAVVATIEKPYGAGELLEVLGRVAGGGRVGVG